MAVKFATGVDAQSQRIINVASPSSGTDAVNKTYVDSNLAGLSWKQQVRAATTTAGVLALTFENGDTLDGVTLATNDRILIKDQAVATENGVYIVAASGSPTRATDADSSAELNSATVFVLAGTVNADTAWTQTTDNPTIGSSNIVWTQFGAGGGVTYTFGDGLVEAGGDVDVELTANSGLSLSGGTLGVASSIAGSALTLTSGVLDVVPGTGLEISSDTVRIAAAAAGDGLTGGGASALAVNVGDGLEIASDLVAIDLATNSGLAFSSGDLSIDTSIVARKFVGSIGDGSTTAIAVTHNLGTKDCVVGLRLNSDDSVIYADVVMTSTTVATVTFAVAPASNAVRFTAIG